LVGIGGRQQQNRSISARRAEPNQYNLLNGITNAGRNQYAAVYGR